MYTNDVDYKDQLRKFLKLWKTERKKLQTALQKEKSIDFPGRIKTTELTMMEEREKQLKKYIRDGKSKLDALSRRVRQLKAMDILDQVEDEEKELMSADRRDDLIGETITEIVALTEELDKQKHRYGKTYFTRHEVQVNTDQLRELNEKLKHLKKEDLQFHEKRLEVIKQDLASSGPGEWVDLEGLRGELECKIQRIRKELEQL
ncbi:hypothetical protein C900_05386 [Fulvivirga imtechensis AK7]|uniref:Uncharacterized protein n=2 Tax=Fulvivirga TaxID=396811 RepID=L8JK51_9BACT|nr:hypothetical protein C900_05386 [Fulvivirga imtechensis AK7]